MATWRRDIPRQMSQFELGWVVAFIEGEGHFHCGASQKGITMGVRACQVQREPIERLVQYTGLGKVYGPYHRGGQRKPIHTWEVYGKTAESFIELIQPFLSPKRQAQSGAALAAYRARPQMSPSEAAKRGHALRRERKANDPRQLRMVQ